VYCTLEDLIARYGADELRASADRDEDGVPDEAVVAAAVADAGAEIDVRLARRFSLPLQQVPPVVRMLACDIARYRLLQDRPHEQAIERYKAAVTLLDAIASGAVSLAGLEAPGNDVRAESSPSLFGPQAAEDFTGGVR
jgi:phage gp36-like protein